MFFTPDFRYRCYRASLRLGLVLLAAGAIVYLPSGRGQDAAPRQSEGQATLMREGTRVVDRSALCRSSGERLVVTLDEDSPPLVALENLAAQRILKAVLDDTEDALWILDGQVTEFQDRNYLLIERVVRQTKTK